MSDDYKFRINICNSSDSDDGCPVFFMEDPHEKKGIATIKEDGTISICKEKGKKVKIAFRLQDGVYDGYTFDLTKSFSATKVPSGEAGNFSFALDDAGDPELSPSNVKDDSRTLVVTDKNDDGGDWRYTLEIFNDGKSVTIDPMIKNSVV
ncbi:hypothetical protein [Microbulbifer hydrolyticus]|uniref:Uncharacterized protein n=1 Tax=Microbulbifer hydrolyticus TaxID=48074 RepID=A0A6P1T8B7_9GAMM|nr:hypothetical protein [Microbulbifer hydrolyticus]MBB5211269.1 hypothetical protein [Microbulbifer hydrolyticus]QHQ37965.1 hypothetical protein GTQ55_02435 [Microbulbifer hydrolyticus]